MMSSYETVWEFERRVAEFCGAKHGVATDTCTNALFLSCKYMMVGAVILPARTYISVPAAIIHAGGSVKFVDYAWTGRYTLHPYPIYDSALRFRRGMYHGGLQCVSFQMRKLLPIGRGGMILTDDGEAVEWLRKARSNGRNLAVPYVKDSIGMLGWDMAMTPEQGARGLQLLETLDGNLPDQINEYPDLRRMPIFAEPMEVAA